MQNIELALCVCAHLLGTLDYLLDRHRFSSAISPLATIAGDIMNVINNNAALLSNYEVYELLCGLQNADKSGGGHRKKSLPPNLATVAYSTVKYLEQTPCRDQSSSTVEQFMRAVEPFGLTKGEKLLLLNHRPTSAVMLSICVEEYDARLTDEEIASLLEVVTTCLPGPEPPSSGAADDREDDAMQEEYPGNS